MIKSSELSDADIEELDDFLARVDGGKIPNCEALDGFFAALACCPELIMPSEYLAIIQSGKTEKGDLVFENIDETQRFMELVTQHWNHVNVPLNQGEAFLPLVLEDENGDYHCNEWANGFLTGMDMRNEIWADYLDDQEHSGPIVPIMALAHENHPDPKMRPYKKPIDKDGREKLFIALAAGVMHIFNYFRGNRETYIPKTETFIRTEKKVGRNESCPCGSGKKYKQCCGRGPTLH
jgi:uncharacterized protein